MSILLVHLIATCFMTGLIWFVQIVHYPLFARVGQAESIEYALRHQQRTTWVVLPVMFVELTAAIVLVANPPASIGRWMPWLGLAMLLAIWISTFALQVPQHAKLARGFDPAAIRRLNATNWVRTLLWTARATLAAVMLTPH